MAYSHPDYGDAKNTLKKSTGAKFPSGEYTLEKKEQHYTPHRCWTIINTVNIGQAVTGMMEEKQKKEEFMLWALQSDICENVSLKANERLCRK